MDRTRSSIRRRKSFAQDTVRGQDEQLFRLFLFPELFQPGGEGQSRTHRRCMEPARTGITLAMGKSISLRTIWLSLHYKRPIRARFPRHSSSQSCRAQHERFPSQGYGCRIPVKRGMA